MTGTEQTRRTPSAEQTPQLDPAEQRDMVEQFEEERPGRRLGGLPAAIVATGSVGLSVYAIYWVLNPVTAQVYRTTFLAAALALTFLVYGARGRRQAPAEEDRAGRRETERPTILDWLLAVLAIVALGYTLVTFDEFVRRSVEPNTLDLTFGAVTILLVLEAARRTTGWILPAICIAFLAYAYYGGYIPPAWELGHRGYGVDRIVGQSYMGLEGIFGVPLDVAATYIILFCIYGAVLEYSGAAQFFIDVSFAVFGRSRSGPGRTTALAGFLLGTVSGSGAATTVTLGTVTWPILRRGGYPREQGGGVLAASGIGAILSPPTLGAAAFIIAEFLGISYLRVLLFATVPTFLYYLGIMLAIEADARRLGMSETEVRTPPLGRLLLRFGYHFSSLFLIVVLLASGLSPFRSVLYATVVAFALSFLDRRNAMTPRRVWDALAAGARAVLPIAATCAAAGIIVAAVTLTGLGIKMSSMIIDVSGGSLLVTTVMSAIAVLILGLAVPVTASFIIAAVIIGPALTELGVPREVAYMFIFYYAVLSEVSPPTALSAFAAAAITGGDPFRTMMQTWKYSLPAFLVPFAFVLSPNGEGLLLRGDAGEIALAVLASTLAVVALAVATGAWLVRAAGTPERVLAAVSALALLYLEPIAVAAGAATFALAVVVHLALRRGPAAHAAAPDAPAS
jgi:TRAP transporter 4TM/12TM fusion protein